MKELIPTLHAILEEKHHIFNSLLYDDVFSLLLQAEHSGYNQGFHDGYEEASHDEDDIWS